MRAGRAAWRLVPPAMLAVLVVAGPSAAQIPSPDWAVGMWWTLTDEKARTFRFDVIGRHTVAFGDAGTVDAWVVDWTLKDGDTQQRGRHFYRVSDLQLAVDEFYLTTGDKRVIIQDQYDPPVPRPWRNGDSARELVSSYIVRYTVVDGQSAPPQDLNTSYNWYATLGVDAFDTPAGSFPAYTRFTISTASSIRTYDMPDRLGWYARFTDRNRSSGAETVWLLTGYDTDRPPVAVITGPREVFVGDRFTLDGSESRDPEGKLVNRTWYLIRPGQPAVGLGSGPLLNWTAETTGRLLFNLVVADARGREHETLFQVFVRDRPRLDVAGPGEVALDEPARFQAVAPRATRIAWDFGDGSYAAGADVTHAFREPGTRTVKVSAAFSDGTVLRRTHAVEVSGERRADAESDLVLIAPGNGTLVGGSVDVVVLARSLDRVVVRLGNATAATTGSGLLALSIPTPPGTGPLVLTLQGERGGAVVEETVVTLLRGATAEPPPGSDDPGQGSDEDGTPVPPWAVPVGAGVAAWLRRRRAT